jgi:hypothetical protein
MPHTSEAEGEEQRKNQHLRGDRHKRAQKVDRDVPKIERDERSGLPPDDENGGRQSGGDRGR